MTKHILIQNGRLLDPASGLDQVGDVAIVDGRIVALGQVPTSFTPDLTLSAQGYVVMPGLVDLAARLREPGHEHEGMLESELSAAAAGGGEHVRLLIEKGAQLLDGRVQVSFR